jgi:ribosomal protein L11 methyltransferase
VALLERYVRPGIQLLDLGCGSGILAIAAAKLGASAVLALDTDPIAVTATAENIAGNDVAELVRVAEGSLSGGMALGHWLGGSFASSPLPVAPNGEQLITNNRQQTFDVIVANIIARVLAALATDLNGALASGGWLIASGIIVEREQEVADAFAAAGLTPVERCQEGDWVALVYQKHSA